jgi:hypothetical protein
MKHYKNIINTEKIIIYNDLNPQSPQLVGNALHITSTKPHPTDKEYISGNYTRYFCVRNNNLNSYTEIDEQVFKSISSKKSEYDYNLYTVGKLKWSLGGDVEKANTNSLLQTSREFPNIHLLFPKLNEYQKPISKEYVLPKRGNNITRRIEG